MIGQQARSRARSSRLLRTTAGFQCFAGPTASSSSTWVLLLLLIAAARSVAAHSSSFEGTMQSIRSPHQQMCSLLFQTPACTQPALWRKPAVARPGPSCSQDTCSLSGPSPAVPSPRQALPELSKGSSRRSVKASAQLASTSTSTSTQKWWKKQSELWVDVHTEEEFYHEISTGNRLLFVGEAL